MEAITTTLTLLSSKLKTLWFFLKEQYEQIIQFRINTFWYPEWTGHLVFLVLVDIVFLLGLFIPLHRKAKKRRLEAEQESIDLIDKMIYLLAKEQYALQLDQTEIGGNPSIALMKSIFEQGQCDYLKSTQLILENIKKVEQLLQKEVITAEELQHFTKTFKSYQKAQKREKIWKGMATICSLWIYALFA